MRIGRGFAGVLVLGLAVRLVVLWQTSDVGLKILDERQYAQLAGSILRGDGLAWAPGEPTSLRPPLYPAFVAAVWRIAGVDNLVAVRAVQCLITLRTTWLVYELGRRTFGPTTASLAAGFVWLFPALIYLNVTKRDAAELGWEQPPRDGDAPESATDTDLHRHI